MIVFIGTTKEVAWDQAVAYTTCFYAALLRRRFPVTPKARREAFIDAHERACEAFAAIRARKAPFAAEVLSTG